MGISEHWLCENPHSMRCRTPTVHGRSLSCCSPQQGCHWKETLPKCTCINWDLERTGDPKRIRHCPKIQPLIQNESVHTHQWGRSQDRHPGNECQDVSSKKFCMRKELRLNPVSTYVPRYSLCCVSWKVEEDLPVPSNETTAAAFGRVCARKYLSEVFKAGAALPVFNFSSEKSTGWAADDLSMSVVRWKHFQMAFWLYLCLLAENAFDIFFRWGLFFFFISACLRKGIYWLKVTALTALEIEVPFLSTEQVQHVQRQHKPRLMMCLSSVLGLATWREEGISCSSWLCDVVLLLRWRTLPLNQG